MRPSTAVTAVLIALVLGTAVTLTVRGLPRGAAPMRSLVLVMAGLAPARRR